MEWTKRRREESDFVEGEDDRGLKVTLPVHDGVNGEEKDEERLVVEGEDDRELVKFPYLSMMEWTEQRRMQNASLWKVRMTEDW